MPEPTKPKLINNSFTRTLNDIRNGDCLTEVSSELQRLITAVQATCRKGKITLTLKVEPASAGDVARVFIEDSITLEVPKPKKARALFFTTEGGGLQRKDPNQTEMDLKVIPDAAPQALKEVPEVKTATA